MNAKSVKAYAPPNDEDSAKNWERPGNNCCHDPMCKTSEGLALRPHFVRKDFRYENPNHRPLRESEKRNESDQVKHHCISPEVAGKESVCHKSEKQHHTE